MDITSEVISNTVVSTNFLYTLCSVNLVTVIFFTLTLHAFYYLSSQMGDMQSELRKLLENGATNEEIQNYLTEIKRFEVCFCKKR